MTEPTRPVAHILRIRPRPKMDASDLVSAVCSCGQYESSPGTPTSATRSHQAHANSMADREYPEHAKLKKVAERSQAIGAFLDTTMYRLCWLVCTHCGSTPVDRARDESDRCCREPDFGFLEVYKPIQSILAEHFEIDEARLEQEKRTMLELMREANSRD